MTKWHLNRIESIGNKNKNPKNNEISLRLDLLRQLLHLSYLLNYVYALYANVGKNFFCMPLTTSHFDIDRLHVDKSKVVAFLLDDQCRSLDQLVETLESWHGENAAAQLLGHQVDAARLAVSVGKRVVGQWEVDLLSVGVVEVEDT